LLGLSAAYAQSQQYIDLVGQADGYIADGEWRSAEECLREAIDLEPECPTNVMLYSNLGVVLYNQARDNEAIEALSQAHKMAPRSVNILNLRAKIYRSLRKNSDALSDYEDIILIDSTNIAARQDHALLAIEMAKSRWAVKDAKVLEAMGSDNIEAMTACGNIYASLKRWSEATEFFTKAIDIKPSADLYASRALTYLMTNRLSEASADISAGLELDPDNSRLYYYRAHLNKSRYLKDDARSDLNKAIELMPRRGQ
jgi:tetratricopeptide (TPR) repeat protein